MESEETITPPRESLDRTPYIIAIVVLIIIIVLILIIAPFISVRQETGSTTTGIYGLTPNTDAVVVNGCGRLRSQPCVFAAQYLSDAVERCDQLGPACSTFTFNEITNTMKVVNAGQSYPATSVNMFTKN